VSLRARYYYFLISLDTNHRDNAKSGVQVTAAASRSRNDTSSTIAQAYARQYFRNDPARPTNWGDHAAQHVALSHLRSCDLSHSPYRRECYDKPGIGYR
jgi:hypothetical protein